MPRLNAYELPSRPVVTETRDLTDPDQPGTVWTLTLREAKDTPSQLAITAREKGYITDYITGRDGGPPAPPPRIGETIIPLTPDLFRSIAYIESLQVPGETDGVKDAPYTAPELLLISVQMPQAFMDAVIWAGEMMAGRVRKIDPIESVKTNP